jgi:ribonucleoside-diphosphate reductase alpha chain
MQIDLLFAPNADNPLDGIEFVDRQSVITSRDGSVVFDAQIVAPAAWSQTAVDMLAQKYARKAFTDCLSAVSILVF